MVSIALVDGRITSFTGVQNSRKIGSPLCGSDIAASRFVDNAPHRRWLNPPPLGKKLDPPLGLTEPLSTQAVTTPAPVPSRGWTVSLPYRFPETRASDTPHCWGNDLPESGVG